MLSQQASSRRDPDSEREVFRSAGSTILSWAWFVVAVIVLVDLAVQGRDHAALVAAAAVLAITGVVYSCAWRPRIVADSAGITVVNPVRDHQVPWAVVAKVDVVNAVRVHCTPEPGASRGMILYSWAVQSSPRSARKVALRREASAQPRVRLTPRPRSAQPPPGAVPRYGEIPEPARDALDRSSAEFTAGRLEERAQHARQAAARMARLQSPGGPATGTRPADERAGMPDGLAAQDGAAPQDGPALRDSMAGRNGAAPQDGPALRDSIPGRNGAAGQDGTAAPAQAAPAQAAPGGPAGDSTPAGALAAAAAVPVAQWAWIPIAAMIAPLALLLLVVLM